MRRLAALSILAAALAAVGGAAALTPDRSLVAPLPVQDIALTGRSVAYVADVPEALHCSRIGYWDTRARRAFTIDSQELCRDQASTGQGVWDVSVATRRFLWLTYTGGNFREWFLWTATTTRRTPRRLAFAARDVDAPPPIVLGAGTAEGIPYAVDRRIVYLGDDGRAIFRRTVESPVRLLTAGPGGPLRVAALLANGRLVGLDESGRELSSARLAPGAASAIRFAGRGLAVQIGREVEILPPRSTDGPIVTIPLAGSMVDVAQGRILWERAGDLGATTIVTGRSARLVDGSPARPVHGQLEPGGLAWARDRVVRWRAGRLP